MTTTAAADVAPSELAGGFGDKAERRTFPCDNCGSSLVFAIGVQKLQCPHCGYTKELEFKDDAKVSENDLTAALKKQVGARTDKSAAAQASKQEVSCGGCGATVVFDGSLTASRCAYCDTPLQVKDAHVLEHRIPVDGVATFVIEANAARDNLGKWVKSRWFAPNEFKRRGVTGKFEGIYMPFFTFDAMTHTRYAGQRGDAYWETVGSGDNKRRVRKVRWTPAAGAFQRFFDDVCIPALKSLPQPFLRALEPWPTDKLLPFSDAALAGKRAHTYEVPLEDCFTMAKQRIEQELTQDVKRRIGGDEQRVLSQVTNYSALTYKHALLPVWLLAYRYGDKPYRVAVNAVTGRVHGERPWSVPKIVAAVIAGLAVLIALLYVSQGQGG